MANTTIAVSTSLDVIEKYRELVEASLDGDSIYIRAKETVERLYDGSDMTDNKKAEVIATTIVSMATSISATSMQDDITIINWKVKDNSTQVLTRPELKEIFF